MRAPNRSAGHMGYALAVLAALSLAFSTLQAKAGDMTPASAAPPQGERWSVLDGQAFRGEFGALGKEAKGTDRWVFEDGMFRSAECEECGFPQSPYWVRFEGGKTAFVSETRCPKTDATIVWRGTIEDGEIEGVFTWTKERWYWTLEKKYWFKGTLADASPGETAATR